MNDQVLEQLRKLIHRESGIFLPKEKDRLVQNRVMKRLRALGLANEKEYLRIIELNRDGSELVELLDAVSTNVTYFNREPDHFDALKRILSEYRAQGRRSVRIWCAASSSGEEPYTLAITANEALDLRHTECRILATDISMTMLSRAARGEYDLEQTSMLPPKIVERYFRHCGEGRVEVAAELRRLLSFKRLNLAKHPLPLRGPIDVIFCRNVMIYFDAALKKQLAGEFYRLLQPGGHLFLSHSENLLGTDQPFQRAGAGVFKK
jgi:chemotaxis protein methyltransferase CheR